MTVAGLTDSSAGFRRSLADTWSMKLRLSGRAASDLARLRNDHEIVGGRQQFVDDSVAIRIRRFHLSDPVEFAGMRTQRQLDALRFELRRVVVDVADGDEHPAGGSTGHQRTLRPDHQVVDGLRLAIQRMQRPDHRAAAVADAFDPEEFRSADHVEDDAGTIRQPQIRQILNGRSGRKVLVDAAPVHVLSEVKQVLPPDDEDLHGVGGTTRRSLFRQPQHQRLGQVQRLIQRLRRHQQPVVDQGEALRVRSAE